jgi:hypothetical protein
MPSGSSASCFGFGGGEGRCTWIVWYLAYNRISLVGVSSNSQPCQLPSVSFDIEVQVIHLGSHNIATSRRCLIGTVLLVRGRKWRVDRARGDGRSLHGAKRVGGRSGGALVGWMFVARYLHELQKVNQR